MTLLVFFDYRVHWLYTGMLVSALSLIVSAYLVKGASGVELLILVLYVGLLGVGVSAFATKLSIKRRTRTVQTWRFDLARHRHRRDR